MIVLRRKHLDVLEADYEFYSARYGKTTTAPHGFISDGATCVLDTPEKCYRIHDWNYRTAIWDDGTPMTFEQANHNYTDLLLEEGHWFFARTRRTLNWLGRRAWNEHRRLEMWWQNEKVLARFRADRGLS